MKKKTEISLKNEFKKRIHELSIFFENKIYLNYYCHGIDLNKLKFFLEHEKDKPIYFDKFKDLKTYIKNMTKNWINK